MSSSGSGAQIGNLIRNRATSAVNLIGHQKPATATSTLETSSMKKPVQKTVSTLQVVNQSSQEFVASKKLLTQFKG